ERLVDGDKNLLLRRTIAVEIELELVLARRHAQSLEGAVEIVDDARVVAVDVNLGRVRLHLELQRGLGGEVWAGVGRIRIRIGISPLKPEPRRVPVRVGVRSVVPTDDDGVPGT